MSRAEGDLATQVNEIPTDAGADARWIKRSVKPSPGLGRDESAVWVIDFDSADLMCWKIDGAWRGVLSAKEANSEGLQEQLVFTGFPTRAALLEFCRAALSGARAELTDPQGEKWIAEDGWLRPTNPTPEIVFPNGLRQD